MAARLTPARRAWPQPDFALSAQPRLQRAPLLLLALAAAALALSGIQALGEQRKHEALQQRIDLAQQKATQARRAARPAPAAADDARAREAAALLAREIDHPWSDALASIERATPQGVAWLSLAHDVRRRQLRLDGVAREAPLAFAVVETLAVDASWQEVALAQFSASGAAAGTRFAVTARRADKAVTP